MTPFSFSFFTSILFLENPLFNSVYKSEWLDQIRFAWIVDITLKEISRLIFEIDIDINISKIVFICYIDIFISVCGEICLFVFITIGIDDVGL